MDFDSYGDVSPFEEYGEPQFEALPVFPTVEFDPIPEFEPAKFDVEPRDLFMIEDWDRSEWFKRDDSLRYADERPPGKDESLRGPFRTAERAEAYVRNFSNNIFQWELMYDGEDDLWYVIIQGSGIGRSGGKRRKRCRGIR